MMKEYISLFLEKTKIPQYLSKLLLEQYDKISAHEDQVKELSEFETRFWNCHSVQDIFQLEKSIKSFADKYQYEFEIVQALCYVMWSEKTRGMYQERQISEEVFWNSMSDLRSQLLDQESSYGRVGLSSAGWFWRFLRLDRIKLGRFEYEIDGCHFARLKQWRGVPLPEGDSVMLHIPSGESMTEEKRIDSYKQAYDYFQGFRMENGWLPLYIETWMLYPQIVELFSAGSNLLDFAHEFVILESKEYNTYGELWRVFGGNRDYSKPDELPQNTSLQRRFVEYIKKGGKIGDGVGMLIFDGEKVITKNSTKDE